MAPPLDAGDDPRAEPILELLARELRTDRSRLALDMRVDELGLDSLDLALAIFELEDRYEIVLPEVAPGQPQPTVAALVREVLRGIDLRHSPQARAA